MSATGFVFGVNTLKLGHLGDSVVEHLPLAQVVMPGSWDRVPHWVPCVKPASPSTMSLPLSVS